MKRLFGALLLIGGLCLFLWAGAAAVNGCVYPFLPFSVAIVSPPSAQAFGWIHGGLALMGLSAVLLGGWLVAAFKSLAARRYRQVTGRRLPWLHRGRLCRLLRRTAVLVWLAAAALLGYEAAVVGTGDALFWVGRLLPALLAAAVLFIGGAIGGYRRCPRCGSRLCDEAEPDPPVWLSPGDDWPGDAARYCPVCGYTEE